MTGKTHMCSLCWLDVDEDLPAVSGADGDDGSADQIGGRVTQGTPAKAHDLCIFDQPQIQQPPAHGAVNADTEDPGALSGGKPAQITGRFHTDVLL